MKYTFALLTLIGQLVAAFSSYGSERLHSRRSLTLVDPGQFLKTRSVSRLVARGQQKVKGRFGSYANERSQQAKVAAARASLRASNERAKVATVAKQLEQVDLNSPQSTSRAGSPSKKGSSSSGQNVEQQRAKSPDVKTESTKLSPQSTRQTSSRKSRAKGNQSQAPKQRLTPQKTQSPPTSPLSNPTVQGTSTSPRENQHKAASPEETTSIRSKARSPPRPALKTWLANMQGLVGASHDPDFVIGSAREGPIQDARNTKSAAKSARAEARDSLSKANQALSREEPSSTRLKDAVTKADTAAKAAVSTTEVNALTQKNAAKEYVGTDQSQESGKHLKAAAREMKKSESLAAHRNAFLSQYDARVARDVAEKKKKGRLAAYRNVSQKDSIAKTKADEYYSARKEYDWTKDVMSGSSDSSDGEQMLVDNPRE